jgi:sigma-B regulation protein RsbU (phosphoserine phosphatase)
MTAPAPTILVVDDSAVNLQVLVRTLNGRGHRILAARNGAAALEIARRARPDLMLLDVMMPDMDGFEVCRAIKAHPETQDTSVIFLSALGEVSDRVSGLKLGAIDYITKPIQADEVIARVGNHLALRSLERELRRSRDRLDRELASAGAMQQLILPAAMPVDPAVRFASFYRTSLHAGGDYFDVLDLGHRRYAIIVADVSGHGAPAAIIMAMIRAVVHTSCGVVDDPGALLQQLNRHFGYLWDTAMYATAVCAVLDAERLSLRVSCAGHPPPLIVRGRQVASLPVDAVGSLFWQELGDVPCTEHPLEGGDRVVFYTDGIPDRQSAGDAMYEDERLHAVLARSGTLDAPDVVESVVRDLDAFANGCEAGDDQTLLVMAL